MIKVWRRLWRRLGGMGKFVAGIAVGASLSYAVASAAQVSRHDGTFWGRLGSQDKTAYVTGYSEAMHTSFGKLDSLKVAAGVFHWKGANRILGQIARELDMWAFQPIAWLPIWTASIQILGTGTSTWLTRLNWPPCAAAI